MTMFDIIIPCKALHWSEPPIKTQLVGIILGGEIKFQERGQTRWRLDEKDKLESINIRSLWKEVSMVVRKVLR